MKKERCSLDGCNIKLTFTNKYLCKCNLNFCSKHRLPELHNCTFNHKTINKNKLVESMKCVNDKLVKI